MEDNEDASIYSAVHEASNNFKSSVGQKYSVEDVQEVWNAVGDCVAECLRQNKAMVVCGLGTFTLSEWELDTGLAKPLFTCTPVFSLCERLTKAYSVRKVEVYFPHKIPCHTLLMKDVAKRCSKSKQLVEDCIQEIIQSFTRLLFENKNIELSLGRIGKLQVYNKEVNMIFNEDFVKDVQKKVDEIREDKPFHAPWAPQKILE